MHLRLLRALGDSADVPPALLLAAAESGHRAGALPQRAVSGRRQAPRRGQRLALGRTQGMEQGRAHLPAAAHVYADLITSVLFIFLLFSSSLTSPKHSRSGPLRVW